MYKSDDQSVEAFFDFLAVNPAWMVFITVAVPMTGLLIWSIFFDRGSKPSRHRRLSTSVKRDIMVSVKDPRDNGSYLQSRKDDFDFDKITFYYNEIGKEPVFS